MLAYLSASNSFSLVTKVQKSNHKIGRTNLLATGVGVSFGPAFGEIKIWNFATGQLVHTFNKTNGCHTKSVVALVALNDDLLVSGSYDNTIKVWDVRSGSLVQTYNRGHSGAVTCLSRIGGEEEEGLFASGSEDSTVITWRFLFKCLFFVKFRKHF